MSALGCFLLGLAAAYVLPLLGLAIILACGWRQARRERRAATERCVAALRLHGRGVRAYVVEPERLVH